jgi:cell division protein FtsZ
VTYEEVLDAMDEDDFVITPVQTKKEVNPIIFDEEEQITLTFDLPLPSNQQNFNEDDNRILFSLDEEIKELKVKDHIELIPVTEANETGEKRYALDDFTTFESSINKEKAKVLEIDEEIVFEKKTVSSKETEHLQRDEIDPMNSPISDMLKERADERRRKMKDFNHKFNNAKVDEFEKIPAYKRQGVNLDETQHSSETKASRLSVGTDDNDDVQLRSNNSFLHDNVD